MRALAASALGLLAMACAAPSGSTDSSAGAARPAAPLQPAVALANAGFEAPAGPGARCPLRWSCSSHGNPSSHRFLLDEAAPAEGQRSLCIERVLPEPWAVAALPLRDPALAGKRVRFSLAMRLEGVADGAGPWVLVHGPHGNLLHEQRLAKGTRGWERAAIEFTVPAQAQLLELGATLEGPGKACIDDARLEVLAP
jgi:hypothetical protein